MNVITLPLTPAAPPAASDNAASTGPVAGAPVAFAGMMAGAGQDHAARISSRAGDDAGAPADDDGSEASKDKADGEDAAVLLALSAQAAPLVAVPLPVATASGPVAVNSDAAAPAVRVATTAATLPIVDSDPQIATDQTQAKADAATTLQALADPTPDAPAVQATVVQAAAQPTQTIRQTAVSGSTASFLLARSATKTGATDRTKSATATDAATDDATITDAVPVQTVPTQTVPMPVPATVSAVGGQVSDAGQSLAATGADRQLDLARDSAWLDGLARDIASTGDSGGTLRFQLSPQQLGNLQVEVQRGEAGASVTLTTTTSAAQAILSDAKPQLLAEARMHGLNVSDARIDLSAAASGNASGQGGDASARQQQQNSDTGSRGTGGFNGNGNDAGRQAQHQARAEPDIIPQSPRAAPRAQTETSSVVVNASETDARYA